MWCRNNIPRAFDTYCQPTSHAHAAGTDKVLLAVRYEGGTHGCDRVWVHRGDVASAPTSLSEMQFTDLCRWCDFSSVVVGGGPAR